MLEITTAGAATRRCRHGNDDGAAESPVASSAAAMRTGTSRRIRPGHSIPRSAEGAALQPDCGIRPSRLIMPGKQMWCGSARRSSRLAKPLEGLPSDQKRCLLVQFAYHYMGPALNSGDVRRIGGGGVLVVVIIVYLAGRFVRRRRGARNQCSGEGSVSNAQSPNLLSRSASASMLILRKPNHQDSILSQRQLPSHKPVQDETAAPRNSADLHPSQQLFRVL